MIGTLEAINVCIINGNNSEYCGIFTIRDCSIFLIFVGSLANESTLSTKTNYKRFRLPTKTDI